MAGPRAHHLAGLTFGRWTVISRAEKVSRDAWWLCRCACGHEGLVCTTHLRRGKSQSCGCLATDLRHARRVHGHAGTVHSREYTSWGAAISRCENPHERRYAHYGGRGIRMCDEWRRSFAAFLRDMGPRPIGTSLDRYPNQDGDYEPSNCRWATAVEQRANRRPLPRLALTCCQCGASFVATRRDAVCCSPRCSKRNRIAKAS